MADEPHVIRGINWRETFPFTNIFRAFRVAVHPTKLILALLGLLVLYFGGGLLDGLWTSDARGVPDEIALYSDCQRQAAAQKQPSRFTETREERREGIRTTYARMLVAGKVEESKDKLFNDDSAKAAAKAASHRGDLLDKIEKTRDEADKKGREAFKRETEWVEQGILAKGREAWDEADRVIEAGKAAVKDAEDAQKRLASDATQAQKDEAKKRLDDAQKDAATKKTEAEKKREEDLKKAREAYAQLIKDAKPEDKRKREEEREEAAKKLVKDYQANMRELYKGASDAYKQADAIRGEPLSKLFFNYEGAQINGIVKGVLGGNWLGGFVDQAPAGVVQCSVNFFTVSPGWAMQNHTFYFILFAILFIVVWAIFGGAIARVSAVHVAREEKLSVKQALRFSMGKFLSFLFAPIIPLAIVLVVGLVVAVGGLLTNVPFIGPIVVGLLFFLALAAGFVMTLVLLGTVGGFNLMYPTIAVEGSDSFDAISRAFSYVYARPWRMLFYTAVAVAYGALCYLFVRVFVYLTLTLTHYFAGLWVFRDADNTQALWPVMWPQPTDLWNFPYSVAHSQLGSGQSLGAFLIAIWVYILIAMMGAFLISFYFSANTIIYYLMRREVDATEMDDVYLEQPEEEFAESGAATVATSVPAAAPMTPAPAAVTETPAAAPAPAPVETPAPAPAEPAPAAPAEPAPPPAAEPTPPNSESSENKPNP